MTGGRAGRAGTGGAPGDGPSPQRLSRRAVTACATASAAALLLAGCGGGDDGGETGGDGADGSWARRRKKGERITLTFWTWVPGIDRAVDLWNERHPEVTVAVEKVSAADGAQYAKMHAAIKAGNPPDLGQIEYPVVPSFLLDNGLLDLSGHGIEGAREKFTKWQWNQSVFGGSVFAVPQASGPMAMFVRQDLFDEWSVPVPRTWHEYAEAARAVRKAGGWIETFAPANGNRFAAYAWQAGARWFTAHGDEWTVSVDDGPSREVADFWEHLVREKLVRTEPDRQSAWYRKVQTGQIAAWLGASWGDALLAGNAPRTSGQWRVHPLPQWKRGANAQVNWGGSTTAVFAATKYPLDARDFALWLNSDPDAVAALIAGGAGWPAAASGWKAGDAEAEADFFGGQHYGKVFEAADKAVDTSWRWGPLMDTLYQRLGDALTEAVSSPRVSFRQALARTQHETVSDLRAKGLRVRES
jgi:multiple sugar transport system substrate-binding protein